MAAMFDTSPSIPLGWVSERENRNIPLVWPHCGQSTATFLNGRTQDSNNTSIVVCAWCISFVGYSVREDRLLEEKAIALK